MSAILRRIRQLPRRAWIVFALAVVAGAGGLAWLNAQPASVSTDNAYLKADISFVAPRVRGLVAAILVKDNQVVKAGDPLVRLDDTEYVARVRSAEADVSEGEANVAAARAALDRLTAEQSLARASLDEARTSIASAEAERDRARDDRKRYAALVDKGYVARQRFETASATSTTADANVDKARAASTVAQNQVEVSLRRRAELDAAVKQAEAQKAKAEATLTLARQDLGDTVIRAPVDGVIGDRKIETGEYVQAGTRLMAVVAYANLYVVAKRRRRPIACCPAKRPRSTSTRCRAIRFKARSRVSPRPRAPSSRFCPSNPARATSPRSFSASPCASNSNRTRR